MKTDNNVSHSNNMPCHSGDSDAPGIAGHPFRGTMTIPLKRLAYSIFYRRDYRRDFVFSQK